jgi:hypothetical protein
MVVNGLSKLTTANDRQSVTVEGINSVTGAPYTQTYTAGQTYNINGTNYAGSYMIQQYWGNYAANSYNFITSVNWVKLRSLSLTYDFNGLLKNKKIIKDLSATLVGTNLFTWTNYKGMDPEVSAAGGTGGSGSTASGNYSFVHGSNSIANGISTIVLGSNITGNTDNTTYVDNLNIKTVSTGTSIYNLGIDSNGNVIIGTTGISGDIDGGTF